MDIAIKKLELLREYIHTCISFDAPMNDKYNILVKFGYVVVNKKTGEYMETYYIKSFDQYCKIRFYWDSEEGKFKRGL